MTYPELVQIPIWLDGGLVEVAGAVTLGEAGGHPTGGNLMGFLDAFKAVRPAAPLQMGRH
jgi:hypothetical protein